MTTLLNLLSALALLVWGTHIVRSDILRVYGAQLRRILSTSIKRRSLAFLAGLGVTSLVQSSNATAVIVCSFVAQGLVGLTPALTIMLGADVGTALMTGVLSFDLSWLSPLLIFGGVVVYLPRRHNLSGRLARAVIGLGLILLALQMIGNATQPIMQGPGIKVLFSTLTGDVTLDALIGAVFAMMTYSSLAAVLLAATLASSGIISLKVALCLTIGANLGSGILALLTAASQNVAGRRVALGSMLFRLSGAVIALPFINPLELWITLLTHDLHLGVVAFHVLYNSARCLLLLPLVEPMSRLCTRLLPETQKDDEDTISARHLDPGAIETPSLALANASREALRIGDLIEKMLLNLLPVIRDNDLLRAQQIRQLDHHVDKLYTAVKMYLARVSREELNEKEVRRWTSIVTMTINLEQAGDIIERIVKGIESKKIAPQRSFSDAGMREVSDMHARLVASLQLGLSVFLNGDIKSAQKLLAEKEAFRDLERAYAQTHLIRLAGETQQSIETSSLHLDLISDMRRMHSLFCASAYPVLDDAGLLRKSRMKKHEFGRTKPTQPPESSLSDSFNPP
ncbi:phosphate:Na+ symporter [Herbaspirillum sp. Sphag1AN]|uniref:Na/Pi cotransporter family protein n=1 Tax=unclassified Herbaspirillum TaxID=2624150 RepID=UPI0016168049|nr:MULTISPECIES: Na/Pi cotransporter family protein [unclassified Herbaspirillum]MBB3213331.1 phosphate:Na+ symporter [Herbaspirillum sp. Sphag1AN]MBB3246625.1 phosphate:Na+ symporter [Herbaspirillum sp. Sphag64]